MATWFKRCILVVGREIAGKRTGRLKAIQYNMPCEVWSKCFFVVADSKLCLRWFKTIAQLYMASCIPFTLNRLAQNGVWISRSSCPRGEQTLVDVIRKGVKIMHFPFPTFLKKKKNCRSFARLARFVWFSLTC